MPAIADIKTSFPSYDYSQEHISAALKKLWGSHVKISASIESILRNVRVERRSLAMPLDGYFQDMPFGERNKQFISVSLSMMKSAVGKIFQSTEITPRDISALWSNTVTGFSIPSLEARLMNEIRFPLHTKRVPIMGLGCMAGIAGINRVTDYLRAYPAQAALFLSTECCSLTFQVNDMRPPNMVSAALFGDGCAAVLMVGDQHPLFDQSPLKHLSGESVFFPDSENVMGWDVNENGLNIILNKNVPEFTKNELPAPLLHFLQSQQIDISQVRSFFAHPGGPKVLMALEEILSLPQGGLTHSWDSLRERGNLSSVSVLEILERHIHEYNHEDKKWKGSLGLGIALGPAFSAELGLFEWN